MFSDNDRSLLTTLEAKLMKTKENPAESGIKLKGKTNAEAPASTLKKTGDNAGKSEKPKSKQEIIAALITKVGEAHSIIKRLINLDKSRLDEREDAANAPATIIGGEDKLRQKEAQQYRIQNDAKLIEELNDKLAELLDITIAYCDARDKNGWKFGHGKLKNLLILIANTIIQLECFEKNLKGIEQFKADKTKEGGEKTTALSDEKTQVEAVELFNESTLDKTKDKDGNFGTALRDAVIKKAWQQRQIQLKKRQQEMEETAFSDLSKGLNAVIHILSGLSSAQNIVAKLQELLAQSPSSEGDGHQFFGKPEKIIRYLAIDFCKDIDSIVSVVPKEEVNTLKEKVNTLSNLIDRYSWPMPTSLLPPIDIVFFTEFYQLGARVIEQYFQGEMFAMHLHHYQKLAGRPKDYYEHLGFFNKDRATITPAQISSVFADRIAGVQLTLYRNKPVAEQISAVRNLHQMQVAFNALETSREKYDQELLVAREQEKAKQIASLPEHLLRAFLHISIDQGNQQLFDDICKRLDSPAESKEEAGATPNEAILTLKERVILFVDEKGENVLHKAFRTNEVMSGKLLGNLKSEVIAEAVLARNENHETPLSETPYANIKDMVNPHLVHDNARLSEQDKQMLRGFSNFLEDAIKDKNHKKFGIKKLRENPSIFNQLIRAVNDFNQAINDLITRKISHNIHTEEGVREQISTSLLFLYSAFASYHNQQNIQDDRNKITVNFIEKVCGLIINLQGFRLSDEKILTDYPDKIYAKGELKKDEGEFFRPDGKSGGNVHAASSIGLYGNITAQEMNSILKKRAEKMGCSPMDVRKYGAKALTAPAPVQKPAIQSVDPIIKYKQERGQRNKLSLQERRRLNATSPLSPPATPCKFRGKESSTMTKDEFVNYAKQYLVGDATNPPLLAGGDSQSVSDFFDWMLAYQITGNRWGNTNEIKEVVRAAIKEPSSVLYQLPLAQVREVTPMFLEYIFDDDNNLQQLVCLSLADKQNTIAYPYILKCLLEIKPELMKEDWFWNSMQQNWLMVMYHEYDSLYQANNPHTQVFLDIIKYLYLQDKEKFNQSIDTYFRNVAGLWGIQRGVFDRIVGQLQSMKSLPNSTGLSGFVNFLRQEPGNAAVLWRDPSIQAFADQMNTFVTPDWLSQMWSLHEATFNSLKAQEFKDGSNNYHYNVQSAALSRIISCLHIGNKKLAKELLQKVLTGFCNYPGRVDAQQPKSISDFNNFVCGLKGWLASDSNLLPNLKKLPEFMESLRQKSASQKVVQNEVIPITHAVWEFAGDLMFNGGIRLPSVAECYQNMMETKEETHATIEALQQACFFGENDNAGILGKFKELSPQQQITALFDNTAKYPAAIRSVELDMALSMIEQVNVLSLPEVYRKLTLEKSLEDISHINEMRDKARARMQEQCKDFKLKDIYQRYFNGKSSSHLPECQKDLINFEQIYNGIAYAEATGIKKSFDLPYLGIVTAEITFSPTEIREFKQFMVAEYGATIAASQDPALAQQQWFKDRAFQQADDKLMAAYLYHIDSRIMDLVIRNGKYQAKPQAISQSGFRQEALDLSSKLTTDSEYWGCCEQQMMVLIAITRCLFANLQKTDKDKIDLRTVLTTCHKDQKEAQGYQKDFINCIGGIIQSPPDQHHIEAFIRFLYNNKKSYRDGSAIQHRIWSCELKGANGIVYDLERQVSTLEECYYQITHKKEAPKTLSTAKPTGHPAEAKSASAATSAASSMPPASLPVSTSSASTASISSTASMSQSSSARPTASTSSTPPVAVLTAAQNSSNPNVILAISSNSFVANVGALTSGSGSSTSSASPSSTASTASASAVAATSSAASVSTTPGGP